MMMITQRYGIDNAMEKMGGSSFKSGQRRPRYIILYLVEGFLFADH